MGCIGALARPILPSRRKTPSFRTLRWRIRYKTEHACNRADGSWPSPKANGREKNTAGTSGCKLWPRGRKLTISFRSYYEGYRHSTRRKQKCERFHSAQTRPDGKNEGKRSNVIWHGKRKNSLIPRRLTESLAYQYWRLS